MKVKNKFGLLTKIGHLWLKKNIARTLLISIIIIAGQIILILFFFSQLPQKVPLFYSKPWGKSQLADPLNLFLLPGYSFGVFIANSIVAALFVDKDDFISFCLTSITVIFSVFCLITLIKIIQITT